MSAKGLPADTSEDFGDDGVTLTFEHVSYRVRTGGLIGRLRKRSGEKVILDDVSGLVRPGEVLAIIGSTGAGKSTLLDILAGRSKSGSIQGSILVDGSPLDYTYKLRNGYVTQDDCLLGTQTVFETFMFHANLKLSHWPRKRRIARVNQVIADLGLEKVRNSRVGSQFARGISGGEKKRVSVGCEILTNPGILFLDEPTTGLDAYNSLAVVERVRDIARKQKRTVVLTIHQPRSMIYDLFDRLLILSGGKVVYFGAAQDALEYFDHLGFPAKPHINPADFLIDVVIQNEKAAASVDAIEDATEPLISAEDRDGKIKHPRYKAFTQSRGSSISSITLATRDEEEADSVSSAAGEFPAVDLTEAYRSSELAESAISQIDAVKGSVNYAGKQHGARGPLGRGFCPDVLSRGMPAPYWREVWEVSKRSFIDLMRTPIATYVNLFQTLFMALLVGSIYWDLGDGQGSIQDRVGALFFILTNQSFSMVRAVLLFIEGRNLFNRENAAGLYSTSAFYISKTIVDLPAQLIFPIVFACISYWMVGFQPHADKFGIFLLCIVAVAAVASSLFFFIGSFSPNVMTAQILSPVILVLFLLFGGFFLNNANVPVYYVWIKWLSFFFYANEIFVTNELDGLKFTCSSAQKINGTICPIPNGKAELHLLDMANVDIWMNFLYLAIMIVVYRLIAYIGLRFLYKEKR